MCDYCTPDRDGFVTILPREGVGHAHIWEAPTDGPMLSVSGPNRTWLNIHITFCPMCGRKLKEDKPHEN